MSVTRHVRTQATVIRAGDTTTLVALADWYDGQILVPVDTRIIEAATSTPHQQLPDIRLWVMAHLTAQAAEDLDLQQWEPCQHTGRIQAAWPGPCADDSGLRRRRTLTGSPRAGQVYTARVGAGRTNPCAREG